MWTFELDKSYGFNTAQKVHELVGRPSYYSIRDLGYTSWFLSN